MEKLDLTKILKDCITGTELYSKFIGVVYFNKIDLLDDSIKVDIPKELSVKFNKEGKYYYSDETAEIDLFPSKDQRDWSKWHRPFVDGDVVYAKDDDLSYILIYHKQIDERVYRHACLCLETDMFGCDKDCIFTDDPIDEWRLATEEEKQKLFDVIKRNGYKWNIETKTLEKIKKEKFDIFTLQPFDKVLVRGNNCGTWFTDIYSHFCEKNNEFSCVGGTTTQCVPYNDETKHLIGTTYKAPSKYITW